MKYEDVIDLARKQDAGSHPGPDVMRLLAARGPATPSRRNGLFWAGAAAAVAAATVALWLGGSTLFDASESDGARSQAALDEAESRGESVQPAAVEGRADAPRPPPPETTPLPAEPPAPVVEPDAPRSPDPPAVHKPLSPEELYRKAESQMAAGKLGAARLTLRRLVKRHPDYSGRAAAWVDWARLEERLGRAQRAACVYRSFERAYGQHPLANDARRAVDRLTADPEVSLADCE